MLRWLASRNPPPLQVKSNKDFQAAAQQHAEAATDRLVLDSFNAAGLRESVRTRCFCNGCYIENNEIYVTTVTTAYYRVLLESLALVTADSERRKAPEVQPLKSAAGS